MTTLVARRFCAEFGLAINTIPQYLPDPPPIGEGSIGSVLDDVWAGLAGRQEKIDELAEKSGQMKEQSTLMAQNSMRLKSVPWPKLTPFSACSYIGPQARGQRGTGTPFHVVLNAPLNPSASKLCTALSLQQAKRDADCSIL